MQDKFTLHCALVKWDVHKWIHSDAWNFNQGPDLPELKRQFDDWVRTPEVSLKLLSWEVLNIHESIPSQRRNRQWRVILKLRHCRDQQKLYDLIVDLKTCMIWDV